MITRRSLIGALFAAPAIVRAASLDGLHLLRPVVRAPLIASIFMHGSASFSVLLDNGETIGPMLLPLGTMTPDDPVGYALR